MCLLLDIMTCVCIAARRVQSCLDLCSCVSVCALQPEMVPHPTYRAAAHAIRAAAMAAMARQQAAAAAAAAEGGDEGEEGEDGELVERLDTSSVYEQQVCVCVWLCVSSPSGSF